MSIRKTLILISACLFLAFMPFIYQALNEWEKCGEAVVISATGTIKEITNDSFCISPDFPYRKQLVVHRTFAGPAKVHGIIGNKVGISWKRQCYFNAKYRKDSFVDYGLSIKKIFQ